MVMSKALVGQSRIFELKCLPILLCPALFDPSQRPGYGKPDLDREWDGLLRRNQADAASPFEEVPVLRRRKPRLLFVFPGWLLFRFAQRTLLGLLFQLPPRLTRLEPPFRPGSRNTSSCNRQVQIEDTEVPNTAQ